MNNTLAHGLHEIWPLMQQRASARQPLRVDNTDGRRIDASLVERWLAELQRAGVEHGDPLLVLAEPDIGTVALMVAAWHLGVVVCPLPPTTADEALERIAADCGARHAIRGAGDDATIFTPAGAAGRKPAHLEFRTPPRITGVDLALIIYTSGSTGSPKGIMLSHANVLSALRAIASYLGLADRDTILCIPPLHFDYGLYQVLFAIQTECRVVLAPPGSNAMKALQLIQALEPTVLPIVPALGAGIAQLGLALKRTCPSVRLITNTGGHLSPPVIEELRRVFPHCATMPMYGLTESKRALYMQPDLVDLRPGSVGRPMPGLDAKVMVARDAGGEGMPQAWREAQPHEIGMLFVRGASVMQGYTSADGGAGAHIFAGRYRDDNWLVTGDLFSVDEDGFFYFRGRAKELIKQGGFCLYPRDIEAAIERHPDVLECVVVGVATPGADEMACMYVRGRASLGRDTVLAWLADRFDVHYRPRRVEIVDAWPTNLNGKIDRKALRQRIEAELWGDEPRARTTHLEPLHHEGNGQDLSGFGGIAA